MKNWLIKILGGYTQGEYDASEKVIKHLEHRLEDKDRDLIDMRGELRSMHAMKLETLQVFDKTDSKDCDKENEIYTRTQLMQRLSDYIKMEKHEQPEYTAWSAKIWIVDKEDNNDGKTR